MPEIVGARRAARLSPQEIPGGSKIGLITTPAGQLVRVIGG